MSALTADPGTGAAGGHSGQDTTWGDGGMYAGSAWAPLGFVIVAAVLVGIWLFMRWAFSGPGSPEKRLRTSPPSADDGLLTQVAAFSRREPALALRAVLSDAGIRSTIRLPGPRRAEVLVFPEDAERARLLAASFPTS